MKENVTEFLRGSQKLCSIIMRSDNLPLPMEILHIHYIEQKTERVAQTYTPYTHQHSYFEAHMPIEGSQVYRMMDEEITLKANEVIVIAPQQLHSIPFSTDDLRKFSLGFSLLDAPQDAEFAWVGNMLRSSTYIKTEANEWYTDAISQALLEGSMEKPGYVKIVLSIVSLLMIQLVRDLLPKEQHEAARRGQLRKRMQSIERFIMDNISVAITDQMVSEHMFLSVRQLDRVTRAERGLTLKALIDTMKMNEARYLLLETDLELKDISTALGFTEISSFIRFFRRFEGDPPGLYRKAMKSRPDLQDGASTGY